MCDGTERIEDEEILYRRIAVKTGWFDPEGDGRPSPHAFKPNKNDHDGISLARRKYKTAEEAAQRRAGKAYFVAELRAGDLRVAGIEPEPQPLDGDRSHCTLPQLCTENRDSDEVKEFMTRLAEKCTRDVYGPFVTSSAEDAAEST